MGIAGTWATAAALAHPLTFNSTITYSAVQPSGAADSVAQWSGAAFDAANIGGSGVNADGGANNGTANDASTRVVIGQPAQGQTFTTGSNPNGYDVSGITVRLTGYTNNTATGANQPSWNLAASNGPIQVTVSKVNGTTQSLLSIQNFIAGGEGTPGSGSSVNGPGTYLTFNLPFPVHLDPNTTYGFDLIIGNGSGNYFELLGTSGDPYAGGTAYTRSGTTITPLSGDRVFQVNMTASASPYAPFTHPGALHTQADFDRMKAKIAAGTAPWKTSYDQLAADRYMLGWGPTAVQYINRGGTGTDNYTRTQCDAQALYQFSLRWKLTGDNTYADRAVVIANAWSGTLLGITGDSNQSLAAGICGYLFATGGEILSTYPGWPAAQKQAYKDMMMRVFYPSNLDFLWRHHGTPVNSGGNTHYRLNWDDDNMASIAAIGILCDNRAVYQQALDYFKFGSGNGRVERAAWYIHPDGTAQTEESGRDQPHNQGGWYSMGLLCQMAWNQGDDLFGYDNNRVLRAYEYIAKYNSGNDDVSWVYHRNTDITYTETLSSSGRGESNYPAWELVYNHYANVQGIAAPWTKIAMNLVRPEWFPVPASTASAQDTLGLGSLTYARDDTSTSAAPSGLLAQWSKNQLILNWWGSATATSYQIQRTASGASAAGPYTTLGTAVEPNLNFTDTTVAQGGSYYYKVVAVTPTGNLESTPLLANQTLVASYTFEGNTNDGTGTRNATAKGATAPGYAAGFGGGQAISLNGVDQYVQFPVNSGLSRDVTLSAWVYWNGGNAYQRVFDFGSEIEKFMMLTVKDGSGKIGFTMTTSRGNEGTITLAGPVMPVATWTHLAVTFNGDTATLYVNGLPVASGSSARLSPMFSQPFCYLGRSMWNADPYFSGRIDNFRIYNCALTGSDVYALWGQSANHAPKFTSNPVIRADATQGAAYTTQSIYTSATDADGETLIYAKVSGPSWLTVAPNGALSGTPANSDNGKNLFIVRVTDPTGATDDAMLSVTVNNTNEAPAWLSGTVTKPGVTRGQAYAASLAANATDPDLPYGDSLSFSKVSGPAWLTIGSNGALTGTPGAGDVGLNNFTVRVTDTGGLYADATLAISVFPFSQRSGYQFDGDATDSVGNFPGTIIGTPTYSSGRTGQALSLDGATNYVTLPAGAASYHEISISTWVYWNGGGNFQRIFDFGNSTSSYLMLTPNSGSGMRFEIVNAGSSQQVNYATALPIGRWVHVAVTLSGSTATLYVNGAAVATNNAITLAPDAFNPAVNYIGKSQWSTDPLFNGQIDDFRIYNYALSAAEVGSIVSSIPPPKPGTVTASGGNGSSQVSLSWGVASGATSYSVKRSTVSGGPYTTIYTGTATSYADASASPGVTYYYIVVAVNAAGESVATTELSGMANITMPKVHLRLDETTGSTAADASGNGWNGTLVGGSTWTTGKINNAVSLSGTTNYATLPSGVVAGLGNCTLSIWIKPNSFSNWARLWDFGTGTTNYMYLAAQYTTTSPNAAKPTFGIRTPSVSQGVNSSLALTANVWNHVALTFSGNTTTMYVNGAVAGTNAAMTLTPSSLGVTTLNYIGRSQFSADPYLNGAVDEFQIYGRALSATEISALAAPLAAPDGVGVSVGNAQAALTWNAVSGATGYNVKRSTVSGGPYTVVGANIASPNWTDTGLINGTGYFYVVTALKGVAESANSAQVSTTPVGPPPVPANFIATSGNGLVTLTWTASSGATSYNIKRSTTDGSGYLTIGTAASATYADSTVTNGTAYYYVATAVGANGESAASAQASATPLAPPAAPTGLTATASNATVTLAWSASSGATSYNIKRSDVSGSGYALVGTTSATGYVDTDVVNGAPYYYVISAQNVAGEGANSTQVTATPVAPPAAPSGAIASAGNGQSGLVWQAVSGASSYTIKRSTVSGGPYTVLVSGLTATSYFDNTVVNGTTYYYVITAVNAGGEGAASTQLVVTPNNNPLRAHLRFDEINGTTTVTDTSGNGWNATLVGGSTYTAGKINNAVSLSGSTNYATLPTGVVAGLGNCTLSTWVKLNSLSTWARLFDFGTGTTNYMFLVPQGPTANRIRFAIRTPSVSEQQINSTVNTPVGTWFHVAVTFSGSVGTLYINGVSAGTNTGMTLTPSSLGLTTQNYIGKSQFSADPYLNGAVDEFQIYGRALSAAEISALAAASLIAPSNVVATPGQTQIALSWSTVSGATGYNVKRGYVSGGPYTILGSVSGTTYTDTSLAVGSPYYYVVSTLNGIVESVNSAEAGATTMPPPPAPSGLAATGGDAQVALTWTASPGAASYQVKRSTTANGPYALVASGVTATSYTDTGLTNGTTYYYVASAVNLGGESANSVQASATPQVPAPAAPTGLSATAGDTQVVLGWNVSVGATSYNVKRATASGGPYTTVATVTGNGYTDTGLTNGTTYYYVVTASNLGGESSTGTSASGAPLPPPAAPTALVATPDYYQVTLTWNASATATSYTVKRAAPGGANYITLATGVTATQYTDTGLTPGSTYDYVVAAANSVGSSPDSTVVEVTLPKVPASLALDGLSQTYDGAPKAVTVTTVPAGLSVTLTYDGNSTSPTGAGSYAIVATVQDPSYAGTATGTLTIEKATATVTLGNLDQTYDGASKTVGVTTAPAGLATQVTYDGNATVPVNAGSYAIAATIDDANYVGTTTGTLVIEKATATIALGGLSQTYDGSAKAVTVTTNPTGLTVGTAYNDGSALPINAGTYAVTTTINDANYAGTAADTFTIVKATASVALSNLDQTYNGAAKTVGVTTTPTGLTTQVTYDGSATSPINAGSYAIAATIDDANYVGTTTGTLVIGKATATIALVGLSQTYDGLAKAVTTTTNPAGLTVVTAYNGEAALPINAGTYAVATTINDANYTGTSAGTLTIAKAPATVTLGSLNQTYDGAAKTVSITTTPAGLATQVIYNGIATSPINAGSYAIAASIDDANYVGTTTGTLVIGKATATIALGGLSQTYNGSAKVVSTTTTPAGLLVDITYNGGASAPITAGSYAIAASINDANYTGTAVDTLTIAKASASVALSNLDQTYNGAAKTVGVTTTPAGLVTQVTYNGSATSPINAGSYAIAATINDANYVGTNTGTLVIGKAMATVALGGLSQTYNGSAKIVSATTTPAGLSVGITYNGGASAPINAGNYAIAASVNEANYTGTAAGMLTIAKATAALVFDALRQVYDGTPKPVTVTTVPTGLTVNLTYDGIVTPPIWPGSFEVVAIVDSANYTATVSDTLVITITALVGHMPKFGGTIEGSVQVLSAEKMGLYGNALLSGDLLVPGTPAVQLNGASSFAGTYDGDGAAAPANYTVSLYGTASLRHVVRRTNPLALPTIVAPPSPVGTRSVVLSQAGQSAGDFATLRNLSVSGTAGLVTVPPGTYGNFSAQDQAGFVLGIPGATTPAVYNLQQLTLAGAAQVQIAGPVLLTLGNGATLDGTSGLGSATAAELLVLQVYAGGLTLNEQSVLHGYVIAPTVVVTVKGDAVLEGQVISGWLSIYGNGALRDDSGSE
ncbi:MAG: alginate lyase family protein [Verrucomicrobia bacterium]|nr:alginate lyase family protein [Verrucomicrobiota bacterium]